MIRFACLTFICILSAQSPASAGAMLHSHNLRGDSQVIQNLIAGSENEQHRDKPADDFIENLGGGWQGESLSSDSYRSITALTLAGYFTNPADLRWRIAFANHPLPPLPPFEPCLEPS